MSIGQTTAPFNRACQQSWPLLEARDKIVR